MKRLIVLVFAALFLFYVAWPAYSGYQIHQALEAQDTGALSNKIDFPSVRASMRDPVLTHVETRIGETIKSYGPLAALIGSAVPKDKISGLVDAALADVVNPEGVARMYKDGADVGSEVQRAVLRQLDKMGGFMALFRGSRSPETADAGEAESADEKPSSGFGGLGDLAGGIKLPGGLDKVLGGDTGGAAGAIVGAVADKVVGQIDAKKLAEKLFPALSGGGRRGSGGGGVGVASRDGGDGGGSGFGLGNVKDFGFAGPLGLKLGVARAVEATDPEVTAQINFQGFDWKVTKLSPHL